MADRSALTALKSLCLEAVTLPTAAHMQVAAVRQSRVAEAEAAQQRNTAGGDSGGSGDGDYGDITDSTEHIELSQQRERSEQRRFRLRARSGVGQLLLLQLAAVIGITALIAPQIVRVQRDVTELTIEARSLQLNVNERQRLNSVIGAFARNITVSPRCSNPPSDPMFDLNDPDDPNNVAPVSSTECASWDTTYRLPTLWQSPGRNNRFNGELPEKEICFITDAQAGNNTDTTTVNMSRWRQVLKCVEWYPPDAYGYVDSTATSDKPGTLIVAEYPQDDSDSNKPFDPASPRFLQCVTWSDLGCNRTVFNNVATFRAYWLNDLDGWLHQNDLGYDGNVGSGKEVTPSRLQTPHSGTEISRMVMYMCPVKQDRAAANTTTNRQPVNYGGVDIAPNGASACARAMLINDPQATNPDDWNIHHTDWDGYLSTPEELEEDLVGTGAHEDIWRFELKF